ncbi:MAG TPA: 4-hydroxy-3-methylbut-2-enyl diphosphate reductase [Geminicoccaceae bacterium]|nr:4-hydroxy-3-methylbut-2-enyl diphosphate reductase [Geminicoccaceae bacterium]
MISDRQQSSDEGRLGDAPSPTSRAALTVLLASPRGFCAGVERAIEIVEQALEQNGPPVYVRHEIVHNRHVVDGLRAKGAVFVEELDQVPEHALVVFSAHGVPKAVPAEARRRRLLYADATCPLVSKVHRGVEQHHRSGRTVLLIGHGGHPEVVGTMGQLPAGAVILVENVAQAEALSVPDPDKLAYATQTTLSIRETESILAVLKRRFPAIAGPRKEDICYATTNRQRAVEAIAPRADLTLIIGSPNSSNSVRLVEVARAAGCPRAALVQSAAEMDWSLLQGVATVAVSAGASAPEELVDELIAACRARFTLCVREIEVVKEDVSFRTPPLPLTSASADRRARLMPVSS